MTPRSACSSRAASRDAARPRAARARQRSGAASRDPARKRPPVSYPPLADYALIGDCHTAALVSRAGVIDWCCLPRFDSDSCFGRLLDWDKGGYFAITPIGPHTCTRRYLPDSLILVTHLQVGQQRGGGHRLLRHAHRRTQPAAPQARPDRARRARPHELRCQDRAPPGLRRSQTVDPFRRQECELRLWKQHGIVDLRRHARWRSKRVTTCVASCGSAPGSAAIWPCSSTPRRRAKRCACGTTRPSACARSSRRPAGGGVNGRPRFPIVTGRDRASSARPSSSKPSPTRRPARSSLRPRRHCRSTLEVSATGTIVSAGFATRSSPCTR